MKIDLWSKAVAGGWLPEEIESGLGGGEESLVLWGEAMARRGHDVRIFHNPPGLEGGPASRAPVAYRGVHWHPHHHFDPYGERDVLISWRDPHPWNIGATARGCIHWSSDVEPMGWWSPRAVADLDAVVCFSRYHLRRMTWLPEGLGRVIPLGVDLAHLDARRGARDPELALYCSSPDRGLLTLLQDWPRIHAARPALKLEIAYGWKHYGAATAGSAAHDAFRRDIGERIALLADRGVTERGQLPRDEAARAFWRAAFWMLPLNRADSELFCLNALKAQHTGATPVVIRQGALTETVGGTWISYESFVEQGVAAMGSTTPRFPTQTWDEVAAEHWEGLLEEAVQGSTFSVPGSAMGGAA